MGRGMRRDRERERDEERERETKRERERETERERKRERERERDHYPKYDDNVCSTVCLAVVVEKLSHMHGSGHHVRHMFCGACVSIDFWVSIW